MGRVSDLDKKKAVDPTIHPEEACYIKVLPSEHPDQHLMIHIEGEFEVRYTYSNADARNLRTVRDRIVNGWSRRRIIARSIPILHRFHEVFCTGVRDPLQYPDGYLQVGMDKLIEAVVKGTYLLPIACDRPH